MTQFRPRRVTILVMPPRIGPRRPVRVYLQLWREREGLTLEQLGGRIEPPVAKGTVDRWEGAKPGGLTLGVIAAFAEALGRPVEDMYRVPPPKGVDPPPSLDDIVADLDPETKARAIGYIEGLTGRKAS